MNPDTLQWLGTVALFVVFLLVMMRGCGGMGGGCGMGGMRRGRGCERSEKPRRDGPGNNEQGGGRADRPARTERAEK